jgi:hypothetical protein
MTKYLVTFDNVSSDCNSPKAVEIRSKLELLPKTTWFQHLPSEIILESELSEEDVYSSIEDIAGKTRILVVEFDKFSTNDDRTKDWMNNN